MTFNSWWDENKPEGATIHDKEVAEKSWEACQNMIDSYEFKIAFVIPGKYGVYGARYKYLQLFRQIANTKLFLEAHFATAKLFAPDYLVVFGDKWGSYNLAVNNSMKYILCEHDVASMREKNPAHIKMEKIKFSRAHRIIFTSPEHQEYVIKKYGIPKERTMILSLRPAKKDLDFEPLPKLEGKHIVYVGGLMGTVHKTGKYGYRSYQETFKRFMEAGWTVHLYPVKHDTTEYAQIGCVIHEAVGEGLELSREISQFTCGLQIFNKEGVPDISYGYAQSCRPNKLWNYLSGGIPTVGYQGGNGMEVYRDKWGIVLDSLDEIPTIEKRIKKLNIDEYRGTEIIESQIDELKNFLGII